jgi:hypothetical protein
MVALAAAGPKDPASTAEITESRAAYRPHLRIEDGRGAARTTGSLPDNGPLNTMFGSRGPPWPQTVGSVDKARCGAGEVEGVGW